MQSPKRRYLCANTTKIHSFRRWHHRWTEMWTLYSDEKTCKRNARKCSSTQYQHRVRRNRKQYVLIGSNEMCTKEIFCWMIFAAVSLHNQIMNRETVDKIKWKTKSKCNRKKQLIKLNPSKSSTKWYIKYTFHTHSRIWMRQRRLNDISCRMQTANCELRCIHVCKCAMEHIRSAWLTKT